MVRNATCDLRHSRGGGGGGDLADTAFGVSIFERLDSKHRGRIGFNDSLGVFSTMSTSFHSDVERVRSCFVVRPISFT